MKRTNFILLIVLLLLILAGIGTVDSAFENKDQLLKLREQYDKAHLNLFSLLKIEREQTV